MTYDYRNRTAGFTQGIGQLLARIEERQRVHRPISVRLKKPYDAINGTFLEPVLDPTRPPDEFRRNRQDWAQAIQAGLITFTPTPTARDGRDPVLLTETGLAWLQAWRQESQGKILYRVEDKDTISVFLGDIDLGEWNRTGDDPSARGYRRVGHNPPVWAFYPAYLVDDYPELDQKLKNLLESPHFEGLKLPSAAKKWLASELKRVGITS